MNMDPNHEAHRKNTQFSSECITSTLKRCLKGQNRGKKHLRNQELCNRIINTRELARITVGDRSFHDIIITKFRKSTPTQPHNRIFFTSLYRQNKIFFANIDDITMIQEYYAPPITQYHNIRHYLGLKKSFTILTPSVITKDSRGTEQPGSTPHEPALLQTLIKDYPITSQKLVDCISEHTSLNRFYRSYTNLSASSRRWLHGQGLILGDRRAPGPVKNIYEHPIVHAVEIFLNKIFRSVKTGITPSSKDEKSKYMGLDFYFIKAKEEEVKEEQQVTNTSDNQHPHHLTKEWDKIEREVEANGSQLTKPKQTPSMTPRTNSNRRKGVNVPPTPMHVYTEIPVMTKFQFQKFAKGKSLPFLLEVIRYSDEYTSRDDEVQLDSLYERFEYTGFNKGSYELLYMSLTQKLAPPCFRRAAAVSRLKALKHSLE